MSYHEPTWSGGVNMWSLQNEDQQRDKGDDTTRRLHGWSLLCIHKSHGTPTARDWRDWELAWPAALCEQDVWATCQQKETDDRLRKMVFCYTSSFIHLSTFTQINLGVPLLSHNLQLTTKPLNVNVTVDMRNAAM